MMRDYIFLAIIALICFCVVTHADAVPTPPHISLTRITDTTQLPQKNYNFFSRFDAPHLNNGTMVFRAFSNSRGGLFAFNNQLNMIAFARETLIPGTPEPFYYFNTDNNVASHNTPYIFNNIIAFLGENRFAYQSTGIYRFSKGQITKIADKKTTIPGRALGLFKQFSDPAVMSNEDIAFLGKNKNTSGIYACGKEDDCRVLVNTETAIPNGTGTFSNIYAPSFSRSSKHNNTFVFIGDGANNQSGIYLSTNGKIITIANQKTNIPGGLGIFSKFDSPSFDAKTDQVAFIGEGILGQSGLYIFDGKHLKKAVDQESVIPNSYDKFNQFSNLTMDNGKILFMASGFKLKKGIFLFIPPSYIYKLISDVDSIGALKIEDIKLRRDAYNNNQFPAVITFHNKLSAVYLATLS